jgi:hypothetical protein
MVKKTLVAAKVASTSGRSLVLFHYTGHGILGSDWRLQLCTTAKMGRHSRSFGDRAFFSDLDPESFLLNPDSEVDVAVFFDCCYSFPGTRTINAPGLVEVLAGRAVWIGIDI